MQASGARPRDPEGRSAASGRSRSGYVAGRCGQLTTGREPRPHLVVGPLLRYVDETLRHDLGRDRPAVLGDGRRRRRRATGADVERARPPLRARPHRAPRPVHGDAVPGRAGRHDGVAARRDRRSRPASSAPSIPTLRSAWPSAAVADRIRSTTSTSTHRRRRAGRAGRPDGGDAARRVARHRCCCSATRCTPTSPPTRSSSGLRDAHRDARPGGRRRDPGLRGVHLAVPRGVDAAGGALAAVDRPDRHAARRPRPARRLEHVAVVAPQGHRPAVVARPGRRRLRARTGCTSTSATSAPTSSTPTRCTPRMLAITDDDERTRYLDDVAWRRRRRCRHRSAGATTATSAGPAAACASSPSTAAARGSSIPTTAGWSTPPSGPGCASRSLDVDQPVRPPRPRLDAAVADAARRPPPRGMGRGRLRGRLGTARQVARRADPPGARPRALGRVPRVVRRDVELLADVVRAGRRRRRPS